MSAVAATTPPNVNMKAATRVTATISPTSVRDVCFAILTHARHRTTEAPTGAR